MHTKVKPVSLRPVSRVQKIWFAAVVAVSVILLGFGWFATVGKTVQASLRQSNTILSGQFAHTKQTVSESTTVKAKVKEAQDTFKKIIEDYAARLEEKKKIEEDALTKMKDQLKHTSTP